MLRYEASNAVRSRHPPSVATGPSHRPGRGPTGPRPWPRAFFLEAVYLSGRSEALHRIPRRMAEGGTGHPPVAPIGGRAHPLSYIILRARPFFLPLSPNVLEGASEKFAKEGTKRAHLGDAWIKHRPLR